MIRENGRKTNTMTGKAYVGALASILLALAFATGCNSTNATPPNSPITTVTSQAPYAQFQNLGMTYISPFKALVETSGVPVADVTVTFTAQVSAGGATGTFPNGTNSVTEPTDSTGVATSPPLTSTGPPGIFIVVASVEGTTTSTAIFTLANIDTPETITATGGATQSTTVSTAFGTAWAATVRGVNELGQTGPVVGAIVTFTAPSSGASGTFADSLTTTTTAITNSSGVATAAPFNANATVGGPYTVTASVPSLQNATPSMDVLITTSGFSLTNTAPAGR